MPARLAVPLLAVLLALGLVGPVSAAADTVQPHHGHAPHHISALVAPAGAVGADRHAEQVGLLPARPAAPVLASLRTVVTAAAAAESRSAVGSSARGPPAAVDA